MHGEGVGWGSKGWGANQGGSWCFCSCPICHPPAFAPVPPAAPPASALAPQHASYVYTLFSRFTMWSGVISELMFVYDTMSQNRIETCG